MQTTIIVGEGATILYSGDISLAASRYLFTFDTPVRTKPVPLFWVGYRGRAYERITHVARALVAAQSEPVIHLWEGHGGTWLSIIFRVPRPSASLIERSIGFGPAEFARTVGREETSELVILAEQQVPRPTAVSIVRAFAHARRASVAIADVEEKPRALPGFRLGTSRFATQKPVCPRFR